MIRNGRTASTQRPVVIDIGAVGKGYLVDLIASILREVGLPGFIVIASGDLRHAGDAALTWLTFRGSRWWRCVGLQFWWRRWRKFAR